MVDMESDVLVKTKKKKKSHIPYWSSDEQLTSQDRLTVERHDDPNETSTMIETAVLGSGSSRSKKKKKKKREIRERSTDFGDANSDHTVTCVKKRIVAASQHDSRHGSDLKSRKRKRLLGTQEGTIHKKLRIELGFCSIEQDQTMTHGTAVVKKLTKKKKQRKQENEERKKLASRQDVQFLDTSALAQQVALLSSKDSAAANRLTSEDADEHETHCVGTTDRLDRKLDTPYQPPVRKTKKKKKKRVTSRETHQEESMLDAVLELGRDTDSPVLLLDSSWNDSKTLQSDVSGADLKTEEKKKKRKRMDIEARDEVCFALQSTNDIDGDQTVKKRKKKKKEKRDTASQSSTDTCTNGTLQHELDDDGQTAVDHARKLVHKEKRKKMKANGCTDVERIPDHNTEGNWSECCADTVEDTVTVEQSGTHKKKKTKKMFEKQAGKARNHRKKTLLTAPTEDPSSVEHESSVFMDSQEDVQSISQIDSDGSSVYDSEETKTAIAVSGDHSKKHTSRRRPAHAEHRRAHWRQLDEELELLDNEEASPDEYEALHDWKVTYDLHYRKAVYDSGAKKGIFSKEEIDQMLKNVHRFCARHSIKDPADVALCDRSNSTYSRAMKSAFFRYACRHIQRTVFSVYRRLRRILDKSNYKGKFTEEEEDHLDTLLAFHGNQWEMIGGIMDRSGQSLMDHKRSVSDTKGSWTKQEEESLITAMNWVAEQQGLRLDQLSDVGIPWTVVAKRVPKRTGSQCRTKWLLNLKCKFRDGRVEKWSRFDDVKLIDKVYECGATRFADVPWADFVDGWPAAGSFHKVRINFWRLKQMVPDANAKTFEEIASYLYERIKPMLLPPRYEVKAGQHSGVDISSS